METTHGYHKAAIVFAGDVPGPIRSMFCIFLLGNL